MCLTAESLRIWRLIPSENKLRNEVEQKDDRSMYCQRRLYTLLQLQVVSHIFFCPSIFLTTSPSPNSQSSAPQ